MPNTARARPLLAVFFLLNGCQSKNIAPVGSPAATRAITASANILDGHATALEDITAAGLILKAGGGIGHDGTTLNAIETSVTTLSLSAGAAGAFVTETNAVTVDTLSDITRLAVQRQEDTASICIEADVVGRITNVANHFASDSSVINLCRGCDFTGEHNEVRRAKCFARDARHWILSQQCIENTI